MKRLIMCSGKVYYDLAKARAEKGLQKEIAIVRLEQVRSATCNCPFLQLLASMCFLLPNDCLPCTPGCMGSQCSPVPTREVALTDFAGCI